MTDREIVINSLDDSIKNQHCGFVDGVGDVYAVSGETIMDALSLLKEQEAVTPVPISNRRYACGNCGNSLWVSGQRFCASCGQAVKWK